MFSDGDERHKRVTRGCKKSLGKLTAYSLAALSHLHAQRTLHHYL